MKQGHHLVMTEPGQIFWQIFWLDRTWRCQHPVCRIEQQNFRRRGRVPVPRASLEVLVRRKRSACSSAVENFKSPQHHDGGRYQRGHRQHTLQGSDSHPYSPLPSPTPGLVDSSNRGQSAGRDRHSFVGKLWFPGHTWFYGKRPRCGAFWLQWCQNSAISRMIGSGTPSSHNNAPLVKSMSSSSTGNTAR